MRNIVAICFDLDDTFWDVAPVIKRAEQALYAWYGECYPAVTEVYSAKDILKLRQNVAREHPELRHDLTALRLKVLRTIAEEAGYAEAMAEEAFAVFQVQRNSVELFDDVRPGLQHLNARYRLFSLSNGNADLLEIGLADYFEDMYSARSIGVAKPDVRIFQAVAEQIGEAPERILHVGDHPENDIAAPAVAGMKTAWINRRREEWQLEDCVPDHEAACLLELSQIMDLAEANA